MSPSNGENPDDQLGFSLFASSKWAEAEGPLRSYLERTPDSAAGHHALAVVLRKTGRQQDALESITHALKLDDSNAKFHSEMASVLSAMQRGTDARKALGRAVQLDPEDFETRLAFGLSLKDGKELDAAITEFREAVRLRPNDATGRNNLGVALSEKGDFDEAAECYQELLRQHPTYALAWNNLGNALRSLRRNEEALAALWTALRLRPDYAEAHNNLGIIYTQLEQFADAAEQFDRSLLLRPDYAEAHANRGLVYLLLGDFQRGWADYEWRWHGKSGLRQRKYGGKPWDGSSLAGKRILLYFEQGLGDTFQFIRYAAELKARGATVIFECQRLTRQILSRTPGIDHLLTRGEKPPRCDFYAPVLGLPGLLQTDLANVPQHVPYIFPDPQLIWEWKQRLHALTGLKVGVVWQGNPEHKGDRNRSIPLRCFEPLARVPGVSLVSLQQNFGVEQIDALAGHFPIADLKGVAQDADGFLRTAAIISNLDLVISADTSVAHLAGAMGVPVWLAISTSPDWRWLLESEDTPWYPTMRLFRQRRSGDWDEVFTRLAESLAARVGAASESQPTALATKIQARQLLKEADDALGKGDLTRAQALLEAAVGLDARNAGVQQDLGVVYAKMARYADAHACFRKAIKITPHAPELHGNLGLALFHLDRTSEAVESLQTAIRLGVNSADVHKNLARALMRVPDPGSAEQSCWSSLRLQANDAEAHYLLSQALLMQGKLKEAWLEAEWRSHWVRRPRQQRAYPRWIGQDLDRKRILLIAEADVCETVMFMRYAELLRQKGATVDLQVSAGLVPVLSGCLGVSRVIASPDHGRGYDYQAYLPSLPGLFGTTLESVPASRPYLGVPTAVFQQWRDALPRSERPRLALAARVGHGGRLPPGIDQALVTRFSTSDTFDVVDIGPPPNSPLATRIRYPSWPNDRGEKFVDRLAVLRGSDVVLATDEALAHMACAIGLPVLIILPQAPHPRWMLDRKDSPWYPTARLIRHLAGESSGDLAERALLEVAKILPS